MSDPFLRNFPELPQGTIDIFNSDLSLIPPASGGANFELRREPNFKNRRSVYQTKGVLKCLSRVKSFTHDRWTCQMSY